MGNTVGTVRLHWRVFSSLRVTPNFGCWVEGEVSS